MNGRTFSRNPRKQGKSHHVMFTVHSPTQNAEDGDMDDGDGDDGDGDDGDRDDYGAPLRSIAFILHAVFTETLSLNCREDELSTAVQPEFSRPAARCQGTVMTEKD